VLSNLKKLKKVLKKYSHEFSRNAAPKYTACCPVPLPISRSDAAVSNAVFRTPRIGPLLRSQASEYGLGEAALMAR
jgi:hypothetical protein